MLLCATAARAENDGKLHLEGVESHEGPTERPTRADAVLLAAAELSIAADCWLTGDALRNGGRERNPLLGGSPSSAVLVGACAAGALGTALVWYVLPNPWRTLFASGVIGVEFAAAGSNWLSGARFRF